MWNSQGYGKLDMDITRPGVFPGFCIEFLVTSMELIQNITGMFLFIIV